MSQIEYIKKMREIEGCSISEIAKRLKINWRTAKKYADNAIKIQAQPKRKRESPVMGPYMYVVDAWLEEDQRMPAKQRRTAKAIYDQLKEATDFQGSYRTVRRYVSIRKNDLIKKQKEQFVKLTHDPGVAQVDFGEFKAIDPDKERIIKYWYLVMSFPHSNGSLARVVPSANTECFLEAMKSMFNELNGVPPVIWFDNLSSAVKKVLKDGKRELTKAFKEFEWHYRFKANFCNVGKGNEKGHVENKVGYIRRNFMSPMPVIDDIAKFNKKLSKKLIADRERLHSEKKQFISQLMDDDLQALLSLPDTPYEVVRTETALTNKYGEIKIDNNVYHVASAYPHQKLFVKIYWDHIEVFDEYGETKLTYCPRKYIHDSDNIDWISELQIYQNKPRAIEHATYLKALPEKIKQYILINELKERRNRIKIIISLLENYTISEIDEVMEIALEFNKTDIEDIKALLIYHTSKKPDKKPLEEFWTPDDILDWVPTLSDYNQLLKGGDSHYEQTTGIM